MTTHTHVTTQTRVTTHTRYHTHINTHKHTLSHTHVTTYIQACIFAPGLALRNGPLTCSRHLMRSPGAMMAVVNTPDSIPAANSWWYLEGPTEDEALPTPQRVKIFLQFYCKLYSTLVPFVGVLYKCILIGWRQTHTGVYTQSLTSGSRLEFSAEASCPCRNQRSRRRTSESLRWLELPCPCTSLLSPVHEQKIKINKKIATNTLNIYICLSLYTPTSLASVFLKQSKVP